MKTFRILPWYLLLLIVGVCVAFMSNQEGFTSVRVVESDEMMSETSQFKKQLRNLPINQVILIAFNANLNFEQAKAHRPQAAIYLVSGKGITPEVEKQIVNMFICHDFDPGKYVEVGKPYAFKKVNNDAIPNKRFQQIPFTRENSDNKPPAQAAINVPPGQSTEIERLRVENENMRKRMDMLREAELQKMTSQPQPAQAQQNSQPSTI